MNQRQQLNDPTILARARAGDSKAHAALYDQFAPMVFSIARRMLGSTQLAEDALQDTFVNVIRSVDSVTDGAALGGWIKRIAINHCLSLLRSSWHLRRAHIEVPEMVPTSVSNPTDAQIELTRLLDNLPIKARIVVWLHDVEGYTHQEIGQLMGRSPSFSKSQLARAHKRLRAALLNTESEDLNSPCTNLLKTV